jgi:hypothetical protein
VAFAALFIAALFVGAAFADSGGNGNGKGLGLGNGNGHGPSDDLLSAKNDYVNCRVDFTIGVIDDIIASIPDTNGSLANVSAALKADKAELESLLAANNTTAYQDFVNGQLKDDLEAAIAAIAHERGSYKDYNVTNITRELLQNQYQERHGDMLACDGVSFARVAEVRIRQYNDAVQNWQEKADELGAKNYSIDGMQAVIDGAKDGPIAALQDAIDSNDLSQIRAAIKVNCLADNCKGENGTAAQNYHGFAKFDLARLQSIVDKLNANAGNTSNSTLLSEAQANLDDAQSALDSIGGAQFSGENQRNSVWQPLRDAAKDIRDYLKDNLMRKKGEIKQKIDDKKQEIQDKLDSIRNRTQNRSQDQNQTGNGFGFGKGKQGNSSGDDTNLSETENESNNGDSGKMNGNRGNSGKGKGGSDDSGGNEPEDEAENESG